MTIEEAQIVRDRILHYWPEREQVDIAVIRPAHRVQSGERVTGYVVHYRDGKHRRCVHDPNWRPYDHPIGTHVLAGVTEYNKLENDT